jgi:DNA-binding MarR family transcriptional regulator
MHAGYRQTETEKSGHTDGVPAETEPPRAAEGARSGPPAANAAFLIMALGRRTRDQVDAGLRALGLTYRHFSALGHLAGQPGLSYSELGRRAGVTAQSMQATVNRLERDGAVERVTDPGRGRISQLRVTPRGHQLLRAGAAVVSEAEAELLAVLEPEQRRAFTGSLFTVFRAGLGPGRPPGQNPTPRQDPTGAPDEESNSP